MFKRKKKDEILSDHDAVQILDTIDKIIAGNFSGVNPVDFNNPEYGEKLNKMLHVFTEVNNPVVMRLNETMGVIWNRLNHRQNQYSTWKIPASISKVLLKTFLMQWEISAQTLTKFYQFHKI